MCTSKPFTIKASIKFRRNLKRDNAKLPIIKPGTKGPRNAEIDGAIIATAEVEQHTAVEAKADAAAEADEVIDAVLLPPSIGITVWSCSRGIVQIFGKVRRAEYITPLRIEITNRPKPGS